MKKNIQQRDWTLDHDGVTYFIKYYDGRRKYGSTDVLIDFMFKEIMLAENKAIEISKAYGGCTFCYGKGFSSSITNLKSKKDDHYKCVLKYCKCDRGLFLEQALKRKMFI